jgi:hypothetical protein
LRVYRAETASTQKNPNIYFSETWRPLRLCASHSFPMFLNRLATYCIPVSHGA